MDGGRWVTLPNGTHVFIDGASGAIMKGPKSVTGKKLSDLGDFKDSDFAKSSTGSSGSYKTGDKVTIGKHTFEKISTGSFKYTDPYGKVRYKKPWEMDKVIDKAVAKGTLKKPEEPKTEPAKAESPKPAAPAPEKAVPATASSTTTKTTADFKTGDTVEIKGVTYTKNKTGTMKYTDPHGKVRYVKPEDFDKRLAKAGITKEGTTGASASKLPTKGDFDAAPVGSKVTMLGVEYVKGEDGKWKGSGYEPSSSKVMADAAEFFSEYGEEIGKITPPAGAKTSKVKTAGGGTKKTEIEPEKAAESTKGAAVVGGVEYKETSKGYSFTKPDGTKGWITKEAFEKKKAAATKAEGKSSGKKTLGLDIPKGKTAEDTKTLAKLEDAQEAFMKSEHGAKMKMMVTEYAKKHGLPDDFMEKATEKIIENSDFKMRIDGKVLEKVLDGGFKTQFETGTSGGTLSGSSRTKAANKLFGKGAGDVGKHDHEKYGYLGSKDDKYDFEHGKTDQYGGLIIRFKRENVADRTTYTMEDSLGPGMYGSLVAAKVGKPSLSAADALTADAYDEYAKIYKGTKTYDGTKAAENYTIASRYMEAQYHGKLGADDIDSITFKSQYDADKYLTPTVKQKIDKLGIKVNILDL